MEGREQLFAMPAQGGEPRRLAPNFRESQRGIWLSDSTRLLFGGTDSEGESDWFVTSVEEPDPDPAKARKLIEAKGLAYTEPRAISSDGASVSFSAQLGDANSTWIAPFHEKRGKVTGPPVRVTAGTTYEANSAFDPDGNLAFVAADIRYQIWSLPLKGSENAPLTPVTSGERLDLYPSLSSDSRTLVNMSVGPDGTEIALLDRSTGHTTMLTDSEQREQFPVISPDGRRFAYHVFDGGTKIFVRDVAGGASKQVCDGCGRVREWTPDGRFLVVQRSNGPISDQIDIARIRTEVFEIETSQSQTLYAVPHASVGQARVSPDGRWTVFQVQTDHEAVQLFVAPLRTDAPVPSEEWIPITDGSEEDLKPAWSRSGDAIYFASQRLEMRSLWVQPLEPASKRPTGPARLVREFQTGTLAIESATPGQFELALTADEIIFPAVHFSGGIWMIERATE